MPVLLERGMTAAAFDDYLEASDGTSQLAGKLAAGVDGNLLIVVLDPLHSHTGYGPKPTHTPPP